MPDISQIYIGGKPVTGVLRFEQRMAFSKHTVVTLDCRYSRRPTDGTSPEVAPEWSPVTFQLGDHTWYGYVLAGGIVSDTKDVAGSALRYTIMGTSMPLNDERTMAYRSTSRSAIVRTIAERHRFRTVISPHTVPVPYYAQTGGSDWRVLKEMAEQTGYRLWVDGSTTLFVDPTVLLEGVRDSEIPTYTQNFAPGMGDSLIRFNSKAGTLVNREAGSTRRQVTYGLDAQTGLPITAAATPTLGIASAPLLNHVVQGSISTAGSARTLVEAGVANTRGWVTASAEVNGSARLVPGSIIGIGGSAIPVDQQGRWLVTDVVHRIIRDGSKTQRLFTSELALERDRYRGPSFTSAFRVSNTAKHVPATMRNGVLWESEQLENIRVG